MDTKKRKISHDYNLRSKTRRIQLRSRSRQRNRDASSSSSHQESPDQQSSNSIQQRQRSSRSEEQQRSSRCQKRHKRGSNQPCPCKKTSLASKKPNAATDDVECVICLDTVVDREMKYIPCGHGFHKICCNNWLSVNDACPVCRTVVRANLLRDNRDRIIHDTPISDIIYFFSLSVIRT